jgi:hypothetical protein
VRQLNSTAARVLLLYAAGAVLLAHAAWLTPTRRWVGGCCDPEQAMWFLRWVPYAISHLTSPFFTHQLVAPSGVNLMWTTPTIAASLLASPVTLLFGPVVAYNVVVTAAIALSAWTAFLMLRRYTRGVVAPLIGGAVYGFSPYVVPQAVEHLDLALALVPPLMVLCLDEILVRRRRPVLMGIALGALAFAQLLTAEELLVTFPLIAIFGIAVLIWHARSRLRSVIPFAVRGAVAALITVGVLAAWPLATQFFGPQRVHGPLQDAERFSTDLLNLITPTGYQLIAPDIAKPVAMQFAGGLNFEANAYVGVLLLVVLGAFVFRQWRDARVRVAAVTALAAFILSLGPHLRVNGQATGIPMPLWPLLKIPVLENIQPNRIAVLMWLSVAALVALAIRSAAQRRSRRAAAPRLAALGVALVPVLPASLPAWLADVPPFFQQWSAQGIPATETVLFAPFFRDGAGADPMLWAAVAGDEPRMPEGYAFVPWPNDRAAYGPPPTQLSIVMEKIQDTGATLVVRGALRGAIAADLRRADVRDVVVGPMANRRQMIVFFRDLFGRQPAEIGGVELWRAAKVSAPPP